MNEQIHELSEPDLDVMHQCPSRITEIIIFWVEDISRKDRPQVHDDLLVGWHETLRQRTKHLIGMELLV